MKLKWLELLKEMFWRPSSMTKNTQFAEFFQPIYDNHDSEWKSSIGADLWTNPPPPLNLARLFIYCQPDFDRKGIYQLADLSYKMVDAKDFSTFLSVEQKSIEGMYFCIHVTNLPSTVTSEELSLIFGIRVTNILLQHNITQSSCSSVHKTVSCEAWVKNVGNESRTRQLAKRASKTEVRGLKIECQCVKEPIYMSELCTHFRKGSCRHLNGTCFYKHILCDKPNDCFDITCNLGHATSRQIVQKTRKNKTRKIYRFHVYLPSRIYISDSKCTRYRMKISSLPPNITTTDVVQQLRMDSRLEHSLHIFREGSPTDTKPSSTAYIVNQPSENFLRSKIYLWHGHLFDSTPNYPISCQLEVINPVFLQKPPESTYNLYQ